jgi:16S rRNA processing protein RimM
VRLRAFTQDPLAVGHYGALEAEDRSRLFEITSLRAAANRLFARFAGIDDRNAAARLALIRLYVPRSRLPDLQDADTFYHADLIGLGAVGSDEQEIGTVCAVHDFGAGPVLEIKPPQGQTVMLPFTRTAVPVVDLAAGRLVAAIGPPGSSGDARSSRPGKRAGRPLHTR